MPELPEVETIKQGLNVLLKNQQLASLRLIWKKSLQSPPADVKQFLIGSKVVSVKRRGKALIIDLSSKYSLVIHLKMTGQLVYRSSGASFAGGHPSDGLIHKLPDASTRIVFKFSSGGELFFNDQRKFGWIKLLPTVEVENINFFKTMGPEPLESGLSGKEFAARLQRRGNSSIKAVLLDQTVIAGIGNIYADEALWAAKLHPLTKVNKISAQKLSKLLTDVRKVLTISIINGGSTDKNYVNAEGKKGSYLSFAKVFRRQGKPCPRCKTPIIKIRAAGRGTHLCPHCQKGKQ